MYLPSSDVPVEAGNYRWMVSSEKLCRSSQVFSVAFQHDRFRESPIRNTCRDSINFRCSKGKNGELKIKEAKSWMVTRVIQWAYIGTFDRVCSEHISSRLSQPHFQELIGNVLYTKEYTQDSDEDALISVYNVSAEAYELSQRFMMRDLYDLSRVGCWNDIANNSILHGHLQFLLRFRGLQRNSTVFVQNLAPSLHRRHSPLHLIGSYLAGCKV